jgi:hypothetical protein
MLAAVASAHLLQFVREVGGCVAAPRPGSKDMAFVAR